MNGIRRRSLVEITVEHLRQSLSQGRWKTHLPGVRPLADELKVSKETVRAALAILENSGELKCQGAGRFRQICSPPLSVNSLQQKLRVAVLPYHPLGSGNSQSMQLLLKLVATVTHSGHDCFIASLSHSQIEHHPRRLSRLVQSSAADAWVSYSPCEEVLAWFLEREIPIITIGGHTQNLPVACTRSDSTQAVQETVDLLVRYRHRRMVMICPRFWREPDLHPSAQAFLNRMKHHGLPTSSFNLPPWEETANGVTTLLHALFQTTPPTALIVLDPSVAVAAVLHLNQHGMGVPADVSVISMTEDAAFSYLQPPMSHFQWEIDPHVRRITQWVRDLARGRADTETKAIQANFVPGGTIGPAKRG